MVKNNNSGENGLKEYLSKINNTRFLSTNNN